MLTIDVLLRVTPTNPVGFPNPPINPPAPLLDGGIESVPVPNEVYEGSTFSFDVVYQLYTPTMSGDTESQTDVLTKIDLLEYTSDSNGLQATKLNDNTIRISGACTGVFTDAYYKFLMPDKTVKILPANTIENFLALIEWSIPNTKIKTINHTLKVKVTDVEHNSNEERTNMFSQTVYWKYETALAQFRAILSKGSV